MKSTGTSALERLLIGYARCFPIRRGKLRLINALWRTAAGGEDTRRIAELKYGDLKMPCDLTKMLQRQYYFFGTYFLEEDILNCWREQAKGARVIFDVGANAGIFSLAAAASSGNAAVHAFEPTPELANGLRETVALNRLERLYVHEEAVWSENGYATLNRFGGETGENEGMNFITSAVVPRQHEVVCTVSLDRFCADRNIDRIDLLKLDIQGNEHKALAGASDLLASGRIGTIFTELNWVEGESTDCPAGESISASRAVGVRVFETKLMPALGERRGLVAESDRCSGAATGVCRLTTNALSVVVCIAAFGAAVWLLRRDSVSLGLPIAYIYGLLVIHLPGAYAHLVRSDVLANSELTEIGIRLTAIGTVCFVAGVWLARVSIESFPEYRVSDRGGFAFFCLIAGWIFTFALSPLMGIPSLGAAVEKGGAVWMLGVMLGLRSAVKHGDVMRVGSWLCALAVYPLVMLLAGGFASYGSRATIIVLSVLSISMQSLWRTVAGIVVASLIGINLFVNYFEHRSDIRDAVWGGYAIEERVDASLGMLRDFEWLDTSKELHLDALDKRLNQNYFVGLAATRIEDNEVDYRYGQSLWDGVIALVPRFLWPDKPVFGGSPQIVAEMTGLRLSEETSFGVGNVMEFQINFGTAGVIGGFLGLGWLLGFLDRKAAVAEINGDLGRLLLFFLPAVALVQPGGSLVEMSGGAAAALVAAYVWKWIWKALSRRTASGEGGTQRSTARAGK